jgi:hypothetical protein
MPTTLTLTAPGQPAQALAVPTSWADVSLAHFVALHAPEPGEQRTATELLTGLDAGALGQLAADDVVYLSNLLAFASDPGDVEALLPAPGLPDVGTLPWGVLVLCQQQFEANAERPALASLPYVLAAYRCQLLHGNTDRLEQVLAQVLAAPVTEAYADGAFFLAAAHRSLSGTSQTKATTTSQPTKKSKPVARIWQRVSAWPWPWMRSPAAT